MVALKQLNSRINPRTIIRPVLYRTLACAVAISLRERLCTDPACAVGSIGASMTGFINAWAAQGRGRHFIVKSTEKYRETLDVIWMFEPGNRDAMNRVEDLPEP